MAITQEYSGSATISTTEYDLPSSSTAISSIAMAGIYQVYLDLANLTASEAYILKIYEKLTSGASQKLLYSMTFSGVQPEPLNSSPVILLIHGWTATLTKLAGTDRSISWSIRRVA